MNFSSIRGQTVVLRVDINSPIYQEQITNTRRIDDAVKTIISLLSQRNKIIVLSHQDDPLVSLKPHFEIIKQRIEGFRLKFCSHDELHDILSGPFSEDVVLVENVRLDPNEKKNLPTKITQTILSSGRISTYVFDALDVSHREHSSISHMMRNLDVVISPRSIMLIQKFRRMTRGRRILFLIGGTKMKSINEYTKSLLKHYPHSEIFLLGTSFLDFETTIRETRIHVPIDVKLSDKQTAFRDLSSVEVQDRSQIYDIGPKTIDQIRTSMKRSDLCLIMGAPGFYEDPVFEKGSRNLVELLQKEFSSVPKIFCGGHTSTIFELFGTPDSMSHVFTGGGVMKHVLQRNLTPMLDLILKQASL